MKEEEKKFEEDDERKRGSLAGIKDLFKKEKQLFKTVHTQTIKIKKQTRTVGFQINSAEENKKVYKDMLTQTITLATPKDGSCQTDTKVHSETVTQTTILEFAEQYAQTATA